MTAGLITLPFAYANYQKKKAAYDAALERYESLKDIAEEAADKYQESLENIQDRLVHADENGNYAQYDNAPGLKVSACLEVGMLVGNRINCRTLLIIKNDSKEGKEWTVNLNTVKVSFKLLGIEFPYIAGLQSGGKSFSWRADHIDFKETVLSNGGTTLKPGGRIGLVSYGFPKEQKLISKSQMKLLRGAICDFAGTKLVTSISKGKYFPGYRKYNGVELLTSNVSFDRLFRVDSVQEPIRSTMWMVADHEANLVYEGEAFYPAEDYHRELIADALRQMFGA